MTLDAHVRGGSPARERSGGRPRRATVVLVVFVAVWLLAGSTLAASEDRVRPDDPMFEDQWALENTGQMVNWTAGTPGADIDATRAWSITTGSKDVVVAIIDGEFDFQADDLAANAWANPGGVNGCPAGTHGYHVPTGACEPHAQVGHGTRMGYVIGAVSDNGQGMAGVNWATSLMGVTYGNSGALATAAETVDWVVSARQAGVNVRVINASWGSESGNTQDVRDAIARAGQHGILFVTGAGNAGDDRDTEPVYPCNFELSNVICVAASDQHDELSAGSSFGANTVHLAAPGRHVCANPQDERCSGGTSTSQATAFVSGVAALVWSYDPGMSMRQVRSAILDNVDRLDSLDGKVITGGRVNAYRALLAVSSASSPTPSPSPTPTPSPSPSPTPSPSPSPSESPAGSESPSSSPSTSGSTSSQPSDDTSQSPDAVSRDGADPDGQPDVGGEPDASNGPTDTTGSPPDGDGGPSATSVPLGDGAPPDGGGTDGGGPDGSASSTGLMEVNLGTDGTGPSQPDTTGTTPGPGQDLSETTPEPRTAAGSSQDAGGWAWAALLAGLTASAVLGTRRMGT